MGQHEVSAHDDPQAFRLALLNDIEALKIMLDEGLIADATRRIGAEQELFLVDSSIRPAPVAGEVLQSLNHPQLTTEMGKFNLELNLTPHEFGGDCLRQMENELTALIATVQSAR